MLWSELRLIFKTSSVTPDFFLRFNLILSFYTYSQSFKKSVRVKFLGANVLKIAFANISAKGITVHLQFFIPRNNFHGYHAWAKFEWLLKFLSFHAQMLHTERYSIFLSE